MSISLITDLMSASVASISRALKTSLISLADILPDLSLFKFFRLDKII